MLEDKKKNFKNQSVSISLSLLLSSAIQAIIGYIAVYFFKPLWEKFIKFINPEQKL